MSQPLREAPSLNVTVRESPLYETMGVGLTDRIVLIGHADGLPLNIPYPVSSVQDAIDTMEGDTDSPLVRAMVSAYYAGARDIWLVAAARMDEYELSLSNRDNAYYEQYKTHLEGEVLPRLAKYDIPQIVVPLEAPFNSEVDFLEPFTNYAKEAYDWSGIIPMVLIGTRGQIDQTEAYNIATDSRLPMIFPPGPTQETQVDLSDPGKFISIFAGDGVFNLKEFPTSFVSSVTPVLAGVLSTLPMNRGVTYRALDHIATIDGPDLDYDTVNMASIAKINLVGRNTRGRRGRQYSVVPFSDNTLAADDSNFWSLTQVRLVSKIIDYIRDLGNRRLGSISYGVFASEVREYIEQLISTDMVKSIEMDMARQSDDPTYVMISLHIRPYYGLRTIYAIAKVGPSEGTL